MVALIAAWVASPALAAAVSWAFNAWWQRKTTRDLARLEARLQLQSEAFRLAHSPRVDAALNLWTAFCAFERQVDTVVVERMRVFHTPDGLTAQEQGAWAHEEEKRQRLQERQALGEAWRRLIEARDRAECLLTEELAADFAQLLTFLTDAHHAHWVGSRYTGYPDDRTIEKVSEQLTQAREARPRVAAGIRALITGQAGA